MKATSQAPSEPVAMPSLAWTGERCVPGPTPADVYYEHVHRYLLAQTLVADLDVLDVGAGEGYGAAILAQTASTVTGIDVDTESIAHANARYGSARVRFLVGDAASLEGLEDQSFDAVVCFELIEHIRDHDGLISSVKRVLRPGGHLVVSTPDRDRYTSEHYHNPFHVRELNRTEFSSLLNGAFDHVQLYTQALAMGSLISRLGTESDDGALLRAGPRNFNGFREADAWITEASDDAPYLIAVASDAPLSRLPETSVLRDVHKEILGDAERWRDQLSAREHAYDELVLELESARAETARCQSTYAELRKQHEDVTGSLRWRIADRAYATTSNAISALRRLSAKRSG